MKRKANRLGNQVLGWLVIIAFLLFLAVAFGPLPAASKERVWKGYVCKVRDYLDCKAGRKRIYPRQERYADEETCYREFRKIFQTDPEMIRLYPQTNDPAVSYIFGCVPDE